MECSSRYSAATGTALSPTCRPVFLTWTLHSQMKRHAELWTAASIGASQRRQVLLRKNFTGATC
eukprot:3182400-Amphidinium_carterae.1